jgi:hypothetical protein
MYYYFKRNTIQNSQRSQDASNGCCNNGQVMTRKTVVTSHPTSVVDECVSRVETVQAPAPKSNKIPLKPVMVMVSQPPVAPPVGALLINTVSSSTCTTRPPTQVSFAQQQNHQNGKNNGGGKHVYHIVENTVSMQPVKTSPRKIKKNLQLFENIQQQQQQHHTSSLVNATSTQQHDR